MNNAWQSSENNSGSNPGLREDRILQALKFLNDSRTRSATQQEKEQFLRHKGLTDTEISSSFSRANSAIVNSLQSSSLNDAQGGTRPLYIPPPIMEEPILWSALKSIFSAVGAMAIGVLGYHIYTEGSQRKEPGPQLFDHASFKGNESFSQPPSFVTEDALTETIKKLQTDQELRHKELILSIRELSQSLRPQKEGSRKPGSSVVLPGDELPLMACKEDIPVESVDIPCEVSKLIESGLDSTIQLVLSCEPPHKKLNKSNLKFKKLEGSILLKLCGYNENADFFEYDGNNSSSRASITSVLSEIERQKSKPVGPDITQNSTHIEQPSLACSPEDKVIPPWLVQKSTSSSSPKLSHLEQDASTSKVVENS